MIKKELKYKIFRIIPENSFLMKILKKIYSFIIFLKNFPIGIRASLSEKKWKAKLIDNFNQKNINFFMAPPGTEDLAYFESIKKMLASDCPVILYNSSEKKCAEHFCHPAEIMWLLCDLGYLFFTFDKIGKIVPRPIRQYNAFIIAIKSEHKLKLGL